MADDDDDDDDDERTRIAPRPTPTVEQFVEESSASCATRERLMPEVVATCLWSVTPELLLALDERFGEPIDAYVNGAQVWLRDDGPGDAGLEWRLHPVAGFRRPTGVGHHDLFEVVVYALRAGDEPPAPLDELWEGLEAFPGYGDEVEPAPLAAAVTAVARASPPTPSAWSTTTSVGDEWERSGGQTSIVQALVAQLSR